MIEAQTKSQQIFVELCKINPEGTCGPTWPEVVPFSLSSLWLYYCLGREISRIFPRKIRFPGNGIQECRPLGNTLTKTCVKLQGGDINMVANEDINSELLFFDIGVIVYPLSTKTL